MSAAPSPNLVKKPISASAAWSVPMTMPSCAPATANCATMRSRALMLPSTKSSCAASRNFRSPAFSAASMPSAAGRMSTVIGAVGLDDGERGLRLGLVLLHAIGQAHRDEGGVAAFGAQLLDGALRQAAGGERIDAAADAQHQRLQAGLLQVVGQKVDAALQFKGGIEHGRDMQRRDDLALRGIDGGQVCAHGFACGKRIRSPPGSGRCSVPCACGCSPPACRRSPRTAACESAGCSWSDRRWP
jgi:hypothetical protein